MNFTGWKFRRESSFVYVFWRIVAWPVLRRRTSPTQSSRPLMLTDDDASDLVLRPHLLFPRLGDLHLVTVPSRLPPREPGMPCRDAVIRQDHPIIDVVSPWTQVYSVQHFFLWQWHVALFNYVQCPRNYCDGVTLNQCLINNNNNNNSRMRVMNHNWSARKQPLHLQSVTRISRHSALSKDRIRQCVTSSGSRSKDTDQCL